MKIRNLGSRINLSDVVERMKQFDPGCTGKIKIYHFINILKHNYSNIFDNETLVGLQFELESINSDNCVDYEEFVTLFFDTQRPEALHSHEVKLDIRSTY